MVLDTGGLNGPYQYETILFVIVFTLLPLPHGSPFGGITHLFTSLSIAKCGRLTSVGARATVCALAVCDNVQLYLTVSYLFPLIFLAQLNITSLYSNNTKVLALNSCWSTYMNMYCSSPPPIASCRETIRPKKSLEYLSLLCVTVGVQG